MLEPQGWENNCCFLNGHKPKDTLMLIGPHKRKTNNKQAFKHNYAVDVCRFFWGWQASSSFLPLIFFLFFFWKELRQSAQRKQLKFQINWKCSRIATGNKQDITKRGSSQVITVNRAKLAKLKSKTTPLDCSPIFRSDHYFSGNVSWLDDYRPQPALSCPCLAHMRSLKLKK